MIKSLILTILSLTTIGSTYAEPLRQGLPKVDYKHIVIGKVINVRSIPIYEGKIITSTEVIEKAKSNKTKWGKLVHTGELVIREVTKGNLKSGDTVPVTWVTTGAARPDGRVYLPMCVFHHASIQQGVELQFGLLDFAGNGSSWLFWEAAKKDPTKQKMENKAQ